MSAYSDRVIADGATAYWRLNEASGTAVNSLVAGVPAGTISGGVTLNQPGALSDSDPAMAFDGVNGQASVPVGTYSAVGTGAFTLEFWMRATVAPASTLYAIDVGGCGSIANAGWAVRVVNTNGGQIWLRFTKGDGTTPAFTFVGRDLFNYADGVWRHYVVVVTRGGSDVATLYINGVAYNSGTFPAAGWSLSGSLASTLGSASPNGSYAPVQLDEVAIYKTALSASQIAAHYALRLTDPYRDKVIADGAVAYWRLDEPSGTTAYDSVGSAAGTISGAVTLNVPGAVRKAMAFDGTTGKIVSATNLVQATALTIEAWIKTTVSGVQLPFFTARSSNAGLYCATNAGQLWFYNSVATPASYNSLKTVIDGQWHHCVMTHTGTTYAIYIDGVLDRTGSWTGRSVDSFPPSLGFDPTNVKYWNGALDDVAVYNVALTPTQIAAHYRTGLDPVGKARLRFRYAYR